jgi:hypothetical protein
MGAILRAAYISAFFVAVPACDSDQANPGPDAGAGAVSSASGGTASNGGTTSVIAGILVNKTTYSRRAAFRAVLPAGTFE